MNTLLIKATRRLLHAQQVIIAGPDVLSSRSLSNPFYMDAHHLLDGLHCDPSGSACLSAMSDFEAKLLASLVNLAADDSTFVILRSTNPVFLQRVLAPSTVVKEIFFVHRPLVMTPSDEDDGVARFSIPCTEAMLKDIEKLPELLRPNSKFAKFKFTAIECQGEIDDVLNSSTLGWSRNRPRIENSIKSVERGDGQ